MANATKVKISNAKKGKNPPKRDWMEEEDKQASNPAPAPTTDKPAAKATPAKNTEPKAARKHNQQSYRWVAINTIKDNPGLPQEKLIALMDKAKPGKTAAYWKRRIGRAYKLAVKFNVALPHKPASVNKPAKVGTTRQHPAVLAADGAEEV